MLSVLSNTEPAVQLHVACALVAILLTPHQFLRRTPGDIRHKTAGYVWVLAIAATAISSFWISGIRMLGPFSPIHLLSIYVLFGLVDAIRHIRRGRIEAHRAVMRSISIWGLGVAGLFTFLPGRVMNEAVFGQWQVEGFVTLLIAVMFLIMWQTDNLPRRPR